MNNLYPIFVRLDRLKVLVVGAGEVGHEKLFFILKNSPDASIHVLAEVVFDGVKSLVENKQYTITTQIKSFEASDVSGYDLIIAATNIKAVNHTVYQAAKEKGILVNVADTPKLCDFYLGSIVTRGDLKIAISTNGKSPTFAKRMRQLFEQILPEETNDLIQNLHKYRNQLTDNFEGKVKKLNQITQSLIQ